MVSREWSFEKKSDEERRIYARVFQEEKTEGAERNVSYLILQQDQPMVLKLIKEIRNSSNNLGTRVRDLYGMHSN